MEIYTLYGSIVSMMLLFGYLGKTETMIVGAIIAAAIVLGFFVLQGFGLYRMAKNRSIGKRFLAFVPFAGTWYIGKLAGECAFFGHKIKRAGLYAMLAQIVTTVVCLLLIASQTYLIATVGEPQLDELGTPYWGVLTGFPFAVERFYTICSELLFIFELVYQILMVVLLMGLYKRYYPKNYILLGVLALFIPLSRYVVIFVLRNRKAINYEEYIRARREAYMRQQQQYYNTYGNPYNNPYGRYQQPNQNPYNQPPQNKPEEPFGEFGGKKEGGEAATQNGAGAKDENPFEEF